MSHEHDRREEWNLDDSPLAELRLLEEQGLKRSLRWIESSSEDRVHTAQGELVNFASNDYLGLSKHPRLIEAAIRAAKEWGVGSGASRLVSGSLKVHRELEEFIADWKQAEGALTFSSGYNTSLAALTSVMRKGDVLILDKLSHASLIDAARLCEGQGVILRVFPHNDVEKLEKLLKGVREREAMNTGQQRILVVAESIYSMDGDQARLAEIISLKERYGALLLLDEAHAVGLLGEQGRGLASMLGLSSQVDFQMGTLSKALGGTGGYLACKSGWRDLLIQRARSLIYTTAPSPLNVAVGLEAVRLIRCSEGEALRQEWQNKRAYWIQEAAMETKRESHPAAIFPWITGSEISAMNLSSALIEEGFWAPAIRYPTVAKNKARLRFTISRTHKFEDIHRLSAALKSLDPGGEEGHHPAF